MTNKGKNRLPVTLITGFLGSGKTTFLNHFIRERQQERILVIENEVGKVNIDGGLVETLAKDVVELTAGCLCCSLSDELLDALEAVSAQRDEVDRLVIETTGVADPSSIVQVFLADPMVERYFDLEQVICLADAGLVEDWLEETEEALRQMVMADVILLNKADTVHSDYLKELEGLMQNVNPHARTFIGENGTFPIEDILKTKTTEADSFESRLATIDANASSEMNHDQTQKEGRHKINTFTLTFDRPFVSNEIFALQLHRLVNIYRDQIYRIKGVIEIQGYPNRVILQSVRSTSVATDGSPWEEGESRQSKLVFIGRGVKKEIMAKMFDHLTARETKTSVAVK